MTVREVIRTASHYYYGAVVNVRELGYDDWAGEYAVSIEFEDGSTYNGYYSDEITVTY